jgi:glucosamine-6-phosphate deaminase
MSSPIKTFSAGAMQVQVFSSKRETSEAAAQAAAAIVRDVIASRGRARIVVSTGNSQLDFIDALVLARDLDWTAVEAFHLDEYAGMPITHPASFRLWLKTRLAERVSLHAMHYVNADAPDVEAECIRYGALLAEAPIDVGFIGIGENGHIGFNDPPVADFNDPLPVKMVRLDDGCRRQQVGEGHFESIAAVPERAVSLTCPTIVGMTHLICCVPELRKAKAVRDTIEGPISTTCPASILRNHPHAQLFLDLESASFLQK